MRSVQKVTVNAPVKELFIENSKRFAVLMKHANNQLHFLKIILLPVVLQMECCVFLTLK